MPESDERASIRTTGTSARERERVPHRVLGVAAGVGEVVHADDERHPAALEVVDRGERVVDRRRSTSTTAPTQPRASSSHMNQKRCCPGVPNR